MPKIPDYKLLATDLRRELTNFFTASGLAKTRCERLAIKHGYRLIAPEPDCDDFCDFIFLRELKTEKQIIRVNIVTDENQIIRNINVKLRREMIL